MHVSCADSLMPSSAGGWKQGVVTEVHDLNKDDSSVDSEFAFDVNGGGFGCAVKHGQSVKLLARMGADGKPRRVKNPKTWEIRDLDLDTTLNGKHDYNFMLKKIEGLKKETKEEMEEKLRQIYSSKKKTMFVDDSED